MRRPRRCRWPIAVALTGGHASAGTIAALRIAAPAIHTTACPTIHQRYRRQKERLGGGPVTRRTVADRPVRDDAPMAYDEDLAERVRVAMAAVPDLVERKMFGGLAFMAGDHMACGVARDNLMLRLGPDLAAKALERPHVRPMDMTGTRMKSVVLVSAAGLEDDEALQAWAGRGGGLRGDTAPEEEATALGGHRHPNGVAPSSPVTACTTSKWVTVASSRTR